jgi:hypothetical protein
MGKRLFFGLAVCLAAVLPPALGRRSPLLGCPSYSCAEMWGRLGATICRILSASYLRYKNILA